MSARSKNLDNTKKINKVLGLNLEDQVDINAAAMNINSSTPLLQEKNATPILQSFKLPAYIVHALDQEKLNRRKAQRSDFEKTAIVIEAITKLLNLE
jgi:hypothetical protein